LDKRTIKQFEFIELVVAYEGLITNHRLREKYGISSVQASRILASYREAYPQNIEVLIGEGRGRYAPTSKFAPEIATLSVNNYFNTTENGQENVLVENVKHDFTKIDPRAFRVIHSAIREHSGLQLTYRSMNTPEGSTRVIHPLAFVFAGRRWHIRAFDEKTLEHRDFNLSRVRAVDLSAKNVDTPLDLDWEEYVQLQLRPHPLLTSAQEKLICDELFDGAAGRQITTRRALVRYTLRELEVATDPKKECPPDFQLYLYRTERPN